MFATARSREIANALEGAQTARSVSEIWSLNDKNLELIDQVRPPYYQRLEALRDEVFAKLASMHVDAGSAPELMGEP